jgi:hypothetical protein
VTNVAKGTLDGAQLTALAQKYDDFAQNLNAFLDANDIEDENTYKRLNDAALQCATIATNLAVQAAGAVFDDSDKEFAQLISVTTDAAHAARDLANEVAQVTRAVSIATGMVGLAAALGGGSVGAIASTLGQLRSAISTR